MDVTARGDLGKPDLKETPGSCRGQSSVSSVLIFSGIMKNEEVPEVSVR